MFETLFYSLGLGLAALAMQGIFALLFIVVIVMLVRSNSKGVHIRMKSLIRLYLYAMSVVMLLVSVFSSAMVVKAGVSFVFGYQFAYPVNEYGGYDLEDYSFGSPYAIDQPTKSSAKDEDEGTIKIDGKTYYIDEDARAKDMVNGLVLWFLFMGLFVAHAGVLWATEKRYRYISNLRKLYTFTQLALYSLLTLIFLPISLLEIIDYYGFSAEDLTAYGRTTPANSLSLLLIVLPLWGWYLFRAYRLHHQEK